MRYNDKYDANYKFRRELNRDKTSRVGEMASYPEDVMNEAIDKVYRELDEHDRVIIDGMLNMLQNFAGCMKNIVVCLTTKAPKRLARCL